MLLFLLNLSAFLCGCTCLKIVCNCAVYTIWKANQPKYQVSLGVAFRGFDAFITNIHFPCRRETYNLFFFFPCNSSEDLSFAPQSSFKFAPSCEALFAEELLKLIIFWRVLSKGLLV